MREKTPLSAPSIKEWWQAKTLKIVFSVGLLVVALSTTITSGAPWSILLLTLLGTFLLIDSLFSYFIEKILNALKPARK